LAHRHRLIAIDDIGSGCLTHLTDMADVPHEPMFTESLEAGADLVLGSGDKLLGGPQCGILLGRATIVEQVRKHPLARAIRIDKLTLAALGGTLDVYLRGRERDEIAVLQLLATPPAALRKRALRIQQELANSQTLTVEVEEGSAPVGGGSLPAVELPTVCVTVRHVSLSAEELAKRLRLGVIRIMGRCQQDRVNLDLRSVNAKDDVRLVEGLRQLEIDMLPKRD
jgi:L-seryl-tRNA(Ser) seleniumtransferase